MIIVGLSGAIGSGKSTFGKQLADAAGSSHHYETWEVVAEVASALKAQSLLPTSDDIDSINQWLVPLPSIVTAVTGRDVSDEPFRLTVNQLGSSPEDYLKLLEYITELQRNPDLRTLPLTVTTKDQFRSLLQWLGGYLVKTIDAGIWYDEIIRRIQTLSDNVDLVTVGGVRYPSDAERLKAIGAHIICIERPRAIEQDVDDLTERERRFIEPDTIIHNTGTLTDLRKIATLVYDNLAIDTLGKQYKPIA